MSVSTHIFCLFVLHTVWELSISNVCCAGKRLWSDSVTLTTSSPTSSLANVSLIDNDNNEISDDLWQCTNDDLDSYCLYIEIENSGCSDVEILNITLYGKTISGNTDLFALFSEKTSDSSVTEWITFFTDWDGGVKPWPTYSTGGVFTAPQCGESSLFSTDDIFGLWDDLDTSSFLYNREDLAGGDNDNWETLTTDTIGDGAISTPLYYTIINDKINNEITSYFDAATTTAVDCNYDTTFDTDSGENWIVLFMPDQGTIGLSQFDIQVSCEVFLLHFLDIKNIFKYRFEYKF